MFADIRTAAEVLNSNIFSLDREIDDARKRIFNLHFEIKSIQGQISRAEAAREDQKAALGLLAPDGVVHSLPTRD